MNAENFFKNHSLEEISQKTKISPISLRFIRNKEFDNIPKVKFLGFINIIQKTYKVDLSDLIEEYNSKTQQKEPQITVKKQKENKNSTFFIAVLALILIVLGGFLLFNINSKKTAPIADNTPAIKTSTLTLSQIPDNSQKIIDINDSSNQKTEETNNSLITKTSKKNNITQKFKITIIPNKLLWFKATNIDTNKSVQYLTTHTKTLPKGNYYIKFGHGDFNLTYNDQVISPKTRKVIRILFTNGTYKFMKKPNRYEK